MIDLQHLFTILSDYQKFWRVGAKYTLIHNNLMIVFVLLIVSALSYKIMSTAKATTLSELRSRALGAKAKPSLENNPDIHQEIREIKIKLEVIHEAIRVLIREAQKPPAYGLTSNSVTNAVMPRSSLPYYQLPETRFD